MGMEQYRYALEFRQTLQDLVAAEVERQRPRYQMASVVSIDRVNRKCTVNFPGDTTNAVVNMGSIQPSAVGQVVRVEGLAGDRYIGDVMGAPYEATDARITALEGNPSTSTNLLSNPGFELGMAGYNTFWQGGTNTITVDTTATNAYSGNNSFKVTQGASSSNYVVLETDVMPCVPGEPILISWREKASGPATGMKSFGEALAAPASANTDFFGTGSINTTYNPETPITSTAYVLRSAIYVVPAGCNFFRPTIRVTNTGAGAGGSVYIDDIKVQRMVFPPSSSPFTFGGGVTIPSAGGLSLGDPGTLSGIGWDQVEYALRSQGMGLSGGGTRTVTATGIGWNQRFLALGFGRGANTFTSGYFDVVMPPDGTVIQGLGGAASQTVASGLIPLPAAVSLWYIPPLGSGSGAGSFPNNYRLVSWTGDFTVPNHWIMVAVRNADTSIVQWSDGMSDSGWVTMTVNAGFNIPSGWTPQVRRLNDMVAMRGYVVGNYGTYGSYVTAFNIPAIFRPAQPLGFANGYNSSAVFGNFSVQVNGDVQCWSSASTAAWLGFSNIVYPVG